MSVRPIRKGLEKKKKKEQGKARLAKATDTPLARADGA